jgi:FkbM family methyltransferase
MADGSQTGRWTEEVGDLASLRRDIDLARHEIAQVQALLAARTARPYYSLDDGWALTHLDTGQPFFVNTRDRCVTPWILMGGQWETNVDRVLTAFTRPGMHVVDVGAHMGYYSVKLASIVGSAGKLVGFEPNPAMAPYAQRNLTLNALGGHAVVHALALGSEAGRARLTFSSGDYAQANLVGHGLADHSFEVDVHRLDDLYQDRLDLLKIDAEGCEPMVLAGAQATLRRSPNCAVMIEVNLDRWEAIAPLDELFRLVDTQTVSAVTPQGNLLPLARHQVREYLSQQAFTEAYLFFCSRSDLNRLGGLIA